MQAGETQAAKQREVWAEAEVVGDVAFDEDRAGFGARVGLRGGAAVVDADAEEIALILVKGVRAAGKLLGPVLELKSAWPPR